MLCGPQQKALTEPFSSTETLQSPSCGQKEHSNRTPSCVSTCTLMDDAEEQPVKSIVQGMKTKNLGCRGFSCWTDSCFKHSRYIVHLERPRAYGHTVHDIASTHREEASLSRGNTSAVFGQRDPDCGLLSLHLLLRPGHLLLAAAVLQEHGCQAAQTGALREGEAQHALQDGRDGDLTAGLGRGEVHERGDGRQDGLFPLAGQTVGDQADPAALQDDVSALRLHAEVTQPS